MGVSLRISLLAVCASIMVPLAVSSTKEMLDCRANLTADIRNDTTFMRKVRQADYIFTGKIKELRNGQLHVRVKRAIKGVLNATLDLAVNDTCGHYIRRSYTGIFMARRDTGFGDLRHVDRIVMHFGPVPLTLANLDRLNAAVRAVCLLHNWRGFGGGRKKVSKLHDKTYGVLNFYEYWGYLKWVDSLKNSLNFNTDVSLIKLIINLEEMLRTSHRPVLLSKLVLQSILFIAIFSGGYVPQ
ncbi:uncharacterized protein LOC143182872 [Calliopsis andreniformis]|uniref:uncharacterized protein LOC143182872 n=1 Tax=Calliopsis andreniformis TaxID=337506 RepID=UPI003FCEBA90